MKYGFVYVLLNYHMNGTYKIGMTERSPHQRMEELSRATGVPDVFEMAYYAEVHEPFVCEAMVHKSLNRFRVNSSREFFRCPLRRIIQTIRDTEMIMSECCDYYEAISFHPDKDYKPLSFESSLYKSGEILSIVRNGYPEWVTRENAPGVAV